MPRKALIFGLILVLAGCSSTPKVKYSMLSANSVHTSNSGQAADPPGNYDGKIKFSMGGSLVLLDKAQATSDPADSPAKPAQNPKPANQLSVTIVPPSAGVSVNGASKTPTQAPSTPQQAPSTPQQAPSTPQQAPSTPQQAPSTTDTENLGDLILKVTKNDSTDNIIILNPANSFGVTTNYSITYYDNSSVIKTLSIDTQDNRVDFIKNAGTLIAAAITLAAPLLNETINTGPTLKIPLTIDVENYRQVCPNEKVNCWVSLGTLNEGWEYSIKFQNPSPAAIPANKFFDTFNKNSTNAFPIPSCRNAVLIVAPIDTSKNCSGAATSDASLVSKSTATTDCEDKTLKHPHFFEKKYFIKIADPQNVETVPIPTKGSIDMMEVCGANITQGNATTSDGWQIIGEVFTQANAIKKAYTDATTPQKK